MNYSAREERYNTYSHAIGVGFGIIAGAFLLQKAISSHNSWAIVSDIVFVISMVLMYLSSTLYHAEKNQKSLAFRNACPHCRAFDRRGARHPAALGHHRKAAAHAADDRGRLQCPLRVQNPSCRVRRGNNDHEKRIAHGYCGPDGGTGRGRWRWLALRRAVEKPLVTAQAQC